MNLISKILSNPYKLLFGIVSRSGGLAKMIPDEKYIRLEYRSYFGKKLDLDNPKTFDEKLQWLKLYNRNPLYTQLVDKCEVKSYVGKMIGQEYIIPTFGVWDSFDEIDFDSLPNRFVLKCTHDSGGIVICKDKGSLDIEKVRNKLTRSLKNNFYWQGREWPYKNVKPRILAEQYMEDSTDKELRDYKIYCFNGKVHATLLASNRMNESHEMTFDYFDKEFNHLKLTNHWHPNASEVPHKPQNYEQMQELAQILSKGFPHVRVDFYEVNGKIYFGELTFFDMSGFLILHPDDWNIEWGELIDLSLI